MDRDAWRSAIRTSAARSASGSAMLRPPASVAEAVLAGQLEGDRLANFHKLLGEVDAQERKHQGKIAQKAFRKLEKSGHKLLG